MKSYEHYTDQRTQAAFLLLQSEVTWCSVKLQLGHLKKKVSENSAAIKASDEEH